MLARLFSNCTLATSLYLLFVWAYAESKRGGTMGPTTNNQPASAQTTPVADALPSVPESWPGAFGIYKYSKQAVRLNLGVIILFWLVSIVANIILDALLGDVLGRTGDWISQGLSYLISAFTTVGTTMAYLAGIRRQKLDFNQTFRNSLPLTLKMLALTILITLALIGSLLLLIIPFFFVAPRLALVNYFLVDKDMDVLEAFKASWAATKGRVGKVYGIVGASIAMALLVITIIGIPFAIYFLIMYSAAFAVLYEYLQKGGEPIAAETVASA
jgi:hypothetical protein